MHLHAFSIYEVGAPHQRQYQIDLLGDPMKDKAVYHAASPMTYIGSVKALLLVLQGENATIVPKEQSDKVVTMPKARTASSRRIPMPARATASQSARTKSTPSSGWSRGSTNI
jgi:hypothetical protein